MPTAPARRCPTCSTVVPSGARCSCSPSWSSSNPARTHRTRDTRAARRDRARRLAEHPLCAHHCGRLATQDDHRVPLSEGGDPDDPANRQLLCGPCHEVKTAAEAARGRARGATQR